MENISEIGKRVERLLYSSVIIILVSFFFYFLSSAITSDNNSFKKTILTNFIENINRNKDFLDMAKALQETYKKYADDNKKKTDAQKKEEEDKKRLEIKNLNKTRAKLGLTEINIDKNIEEKSKIYNGLDIKNIDLIRNKLGLKSSWSIEGAKDVYNDFYFSIVYKNLSGDNELINAYKNKADLPISEVIKDAKDKIEDFDNGSVKVFDVDTPIQIPFSLGDMKSKVSLYNIESAGMIFMPLLLVIWIGSISMTRNREIYYIKKNKNIAQSYPHILNIYYFIDRDMIDDQKGIENFNRMRIGDPEIIKSNRIAAVICFLSRILILSILLLLLTIPFYFGAYRIMNSLNTFNLTMLFICAFINSIQFIALIISECSVFGKIFLTEGKINEYI